MNKEKVKKRILELEYQKNELEKAKTPMWIYIALWCIPFIGWSFIPILPIIKKIQIAKIEEEIRNLDLYI